MQALHLRRELAPLLQMTEGSLRQLQDPVWRAAGHPGSLEPTAATALLIVAGALGQDRNTIGDRTMRLWSAPPLSRAGNPLERCKTLGACLTLILDRADVRARLDHIEIDRDVPDVTIILDKGSRVVFSPLKIKQWRRAYDRIFANGTITDVRRLYRSTFDKIADLIAADQAAEKNPQ